MFILMIRDTYFKNILRLVLIFAGFNHMGMNAYGQIHPADGDTVNYRMVGFKVPEKKNITGYILEVHEYLVRDDGTIHTKFLFEQQSDKNKIVATVPAFGKSYKWQVKYLQKEKVTDSTGFNIFSVGSIAYTDTNKYRMRIVTNKLGGRDYFLFVDGTRTMYDMNGNALWYLPNIPGIVDDNTILRDIKVTPFNTITFLTSKNAFEIDYDGNVLWTAPNDGKISGDSSERYHHEFTRLKNGNYMVAGLKYIQKDIPENTPLPNNKTGIGKRNGKAYNEIPYATLIEYDYMKKIVWVWLSEVHFTNADLFVLSPDANSFRSNTHMNAFFFNEEEKTIYTSHRNINRIVKIAYPSGKVLANYGEDYNGEIEISGHGMFYGQHSCRINSKGQLYLYNNNHQVGDTSRSNISSVAIFKEPVYSTDTLEKLWEFNCDIDTLTSSFTIGGGSVEELKTQDIIVCMAFGRNFIVSKSHQVLWDSIIEEAIESNKWKVYQQGYRSYMIESINKLTELILNDK